MKRLFLLLCGTLFCALVQAQPYPAKNIEVILPYAAGGGVDAMARAFSREASRITGQNWIVVNRDGAGGVVGFTALAHAAPDGYTLAFSPASPMVNSPFVMKEMPFRNGQIEPLCQIFENVFAIAVKQDSPIKSMQDLVGRAKANPGKLSYGHAGAGSVPHMSVGTLEKALGVKFNAIAYRGDGPMLPQLIGGELDFGAPALSSITGKNLRVLAVLSDKRNPAVPDAPAITQLGYPAVTPGLNGLYAPTGLPRPVAEQLQGVCRKVVESEGFTKAAQNLQQTPAYLDGARFKARIEQTYKTNAEIVPDLKLEKS
ncbi:MAG TPA: tripartite tricarboxylate transporter substrate binding protein [Burkholderiales bacterium]|jgi:tripartite-type tricarboxylate transporter receptor subunit TctC